MKVVKLREQGTGRLNGLDHEAVRDAGKPRHGGTETHQLIYNYGHEHPASLEASVTGIEIQHHYRQSLKDSGS